MFPLELQSHPTRFVAFFQDISINIVNINVKKIFEIVGIWNSVYILNVETKVETKVESNVLLE